MDNEKLSFDLNNTSSQKVVLIFGISSSLHANEDLTGKFLLCPKLLWGFEFISFNKVNVVDTDINNVTKVNQYYYETDSK